jgi:hypothetical protein
MRLFLRSVVACLCVCWGPWCASATPAVVIAEAPEPVLTTVAQIQAHAAAGESQPRSVRLEGVVTFVDVSGGVLYLHDPTGSMAVGGWDKAQAVQAGMRVAVDGVTAEGEFAPIVRATRLRLLGPAPLPEAVPTKTLAPEAPNGMVGGVTLIAPLAATAMVPSVVEGRVWETALFSNHS